MVNSRLIVFLMMCNGMLYKTIGFSNPKYVGDPLNAVKIFNDLEVDELVIVDASEEDVTLGGQPKKTFALVDDAGTWLQCVAVGRNALSSCLRNDMEVVAYYVSGKVGQRGSGGSVWLFKDSMLVPIGSKSIQKRNQVELMAKV